MDSHFDQKVTDGDNQLNRDLVSAFQQQNIDNKQNNQILVDDQADENDDPNQQQQDRSEDNNLDDETQNNNDQKKNNKSTTSNDVKDQTPAMNERPKFSNTNYNNFNSNGSCNSSFVLQYSASNTKSKSPALQHHSGQATVSSYAKHLNSNYQKVNNIGASSYQSKHQNYQSKYANHNRSGSREYQQYDNSRSRSGSRSRYVVQQPALNQTSNNFQQYNTNYLKNQLDQFDLKSEHEVYRPSKNYNYSTREEIIQNYKSEIRQARIFDRDYERLQKAVNDLKNRRDKLEDSLQSQRKDNSEKLNEQSTLIEQMQLELETTRDMNFEQNQLITTFNGQVNDIMQDANQAEVNLHQLKTEIKQVDQSNADLEVELQKQRENYDHAQEVKHEQQQKKLYQLSSAIQRNDQECQSLHAKKQIHEREIESLYQQERKLEGLIISKEQLIEQSYQRHAYTQNDIQSLREQIRTSRQDIKNYNGENKRLLENQRQLARHLDAEALKNKEFANALRASHMNYEQQDGQINMIQREIEQTLRSTDNLLVQNNQSKGELETLRSHARVLMGQNTDLQHELSEFLLADDSVREGLNRKDRILKLRTKVADTVNKSQANVNKKSSSPAKYIMSPQSMLSPTSHSNDNNKTFQSTTALMNHMNQMNMTQQTLARTQILEEARNINTLNATRQLQDLKNYSRADNNSSYHNDRSQSPLRKNKKTH